MVTTASGEATKCRPMYSASARASSPASRQRSPKAAAKAAGPSSHSASTSGSASSGQRAHHAAHGAAAVPRVAAPPPASAGYSACDTAPPTSVAGAFR